MHIFEYYTFFDRFSYIIYLIQSYSLKYMNILRSTFFWFPRSTWICQKRLKDAIIYRTMQLYSTPTKIEREKNWKGEEARFKLVSGGSSHSGYPCACDGKGDNCTWILGDGRRLKQKNKPFFYLSVALDVICDNFMGNFTTDR